MRPLCILLAGDPVPATHARRGGFGALIRDAIGTAWTDAVVELDLRNEPAIELDRFAALIVTGSPSSVTERAPWMLRGEALMRTAVHAETPILGLCFGHQLLGQALGGRVMPNPRGREMGTVALAVTRTDPVLGHAGTTIAVNASHVDSVVELPDGASLLGSTELEPNAAIRFAESAWGVQFHPEFDATVMREYIETRRDALAGEGIDGAALLASAADTPPARAVLSRFVDLVARN
jgi:GMP synthase (glutamine-hydrolysing)